MLPWITPLADMVPRLQEEPGSPPAECPFTVIAGAGPGELSWNGPPEGAHQDGCTIKVQPGSCSPGCRRRRTVSGNSGSPLYPRMVGAYGENVVTFVRPKYAEKAMSGCWDRSHGFPVPPPKRQRRHHPAADLELTRMTPDAIRERITN